MLTRPPDRDADRGQRRVTYQQARSYETKRSLVRSALALWRANGYANTTVADICRAAGVSKGLFYFYFPRKEDLLAEIGVQSTEAAQRETSTMLEGPYELGDVVAAALASLQRSMRRNPPELIIEVVLEGYRHQHRILAGEVPAPPSSLIFTELFERARRDGKLPGQLDVRRLAQLAQSLVSEGTRLWAAGAYGDEAFVDVVGRHITALIAGFSQPAVV